MRLPLNMWVKALTSFCIKCFPVSFDYFWRASPPGHKKSHPTTGAAALKSCDDIILTVPIIADGDLRGNSRSVPMF